MRLKLNLALILKYLIALLFWFNIVEKTYCFVMVYICAYRVKSYYYEIKIKLSEKYSFQKGLY